jgi:hypothetical protein
LFGELKARNTAAMAHNASARKERRQADMGSRESTAVAAAAEDGEVFTGPLNLFTAPPPTEETNTLSTVMKWSILGLICVISFAIRLFAVVRWESVIHEFVSRVNSAGSGRQL